MRRLGLVRPLLLLCLLTIPTSLLTAGDSAACGMHEFPEGVGLWFTLTTPSAYPPFSEAYPDQLAYPLDDELVEPDYLLVPRGLVIEEEVIYTCPVCPDLGAKTCKFPSVLYSLGAK
ncbi:MAG TPA: hypothetical protein ENG69_02695, partial [Candidatus Korarchaeota archaeon]|nr:hypothetical protein [Candidatus Korarchaeota archaeon]